MNRVIEDFPTLDDLTIRNRDRWLKTETRAVASVDVGKKFGRLKTKLGLGPLHVFHSIRKTCTTHFEQAEVAEGITADIVGHKKIQ